MAPTVVRTPDAETTLAATVTWPTLQLPLDVVDRIVGEVAGAARPIDDHRSTAEYRRQAVGVLARRALERTFGAA